MMLSTKVDAQCDKLVTVVGRTKLTTLATIDEKNRLRSESGTRFQTEVLEDTRIALQHTVG